MKYLNFIILMVFVASSVVFADTLTLKNGKTFEGTFKGRSEGNVQFESDGMKISIAETEVEALTFGANNSPTESKVVEKKKPEENRSVTVPAGSVLHVRTTDVIDSSRHTQGHKFTAVLEADLVVDGTVVAAKGSTLYGQLAQAKQAGRVVGKSELTILFTGIMLNNQIKPLQSGKVQAVAKSGSGKDTVGKTARAAAIGGLIDGSDGARTGAKVGLGVSVLTRGGRINVPAGTLLDVPLAAPFTP